MITYGKHVHLIQLTEDNENLKTTLVIRVKHPLARKPKVNRQNAFSGNIRIYHRYLPTKKERYSLAPKDVWRQKRMDK